MPHPINLLDHPICLSVPEWRAPSAWLEHTPFAMWLTAALKPRTLVELGTHFGTSYCAFCQAIDGLGLSTRAFAVDTWVGDPHTGGYSQDVLLNLRRHHDPRYGRFSTLLQMTFDKALHRFADGEIDLLHIDGYHTYEAVRHDFEGWRPKLSDRGVILFHDVVERDDDFGVYRLWEELSASHPHFTFLHEHGLGLLAPGPDVPEAIRALVELGGPDVEPVRSAFHEVGRRLRLTNNLEATGADRDLARNELDRMHSELDRARAERDAYRAERDGYRAERDASRSERNTFRTERDTIRTERDTIRSERDTIRSERDTIRSDRDAHRAVLAAQRTELDHARTELDRARTELDRARTELDRALAQMEQLPVILAALRATEDRLTTVEREWDELRTSQSWRTFREVTHFAVRIGPEGSRRRRALRRIARAFECLGREGVIGLSRRQIRQAFDRMKNHREGGVDYDPSEWDNPIIHEATTGGSPHLKAHESHARVRSR